ncbi:ABC transporter ATP-binding protein [Paenibacillus fonticola]|uniref:ABC transporter ATP-binding protein n=1 Tax=Paenibacillus fonticola TaxID=379896 RepID=UPI0003723B33|nr:ABC transporter ATP-binding protein [Paenibacillus fonticola]
MQKELIIEHVTKSYGSKQALNQVTLHLKPGVLGLLGPNGAGKSTLMRILSTIEKPTEGVVTWNGTDIGKHPDVLRTELGYLPQDFGVYPNMNPLEFLEYMAAMKGLRMKSARKRIDELLEILNLANDRKKLLGGFSGGMKQRVGIAQALLNDPSLLIVDEPTVGLDPEERIRFRNLLSTMSSNRIVILSTHIVTDIESIAPNIAILFKGRLVTYTTPEGLIQGADHKVWQCIIPTAELQEMQDKYMISSAIHRSDGVHARIVSDFRPSQNALPLPSTLEDAYLYAVSPLGGAL